MKKLLKIWPLLIILAVWAILFWPFIKGKLLPVPADIIAGVYYPWLDYKWGFTVGVPVKNPLLSDIPSLLYPWRSLVIDELKSGRWPLWNPYYFGGMPLLANFQSAVFSYTNIFFLFFSKPIAWSLGVITSPLLTMLAFYIYLKNRKLSSISSLFGSIIFGLCGFEIAWMEYNVHGHTMLFLPLMLLAIDQIFKSKKGWLLLLSLFVAFQIFAGYIPVVIYSYLIIVFYLLYFYIIPQIKEKNINIKIYILIFLFFVLGLGIACIQILPGYELAVNSIRKIDPLVSASNASYLPLKNLITAVAPDIFGNPGSGNYFGKAFYDNFYFFIGTGTLILIFYSLFFIKRNKEILFWWILVIFSFLFIFKNPVGSFLEKILFLSGGVSARALFITDFSFAILAAFGLDLFIKADIRQRKKIIISIVIVLLFLLTAVLIVVKTEVIFRTIAVRNLAIPIFIWGLCAFTLIILIKHPKKLLQLILLFFITAQLLYSAKKYLPFSKEELLFPKTPIIEYLQNKQKTNGPLRVELGEVIPQNFLMPYKLDTFSGYDALLPKNTGEFLSMVESNRINDRISRVFLIKNYNSPLFPLLNVKYVLAKKTDERGYFSPEGKPPDLFKSNQFKLVYEDKTVQVYENNKYLPRAYFVYDYLLTGDKNDADFFKNVDYYNKIVIKNPVKYNPPGKIIKIKNNIEWKEDRPGKFVLVAESSHPGFLVLLESYYPGWRVFVDGREEKLIKANYNFQSVLVGAGKHLISFEYRPKSFLIGRLISLFSVLNFFLISLIFLLERLWQKKIQR